MTATNTRHVLIYTPWDPKTEAGGVGTMVRTLIAELGARGHKITVFVPDWGATDWPHEDRDDYRLYTGRLRVPGVPGAMIKSALTYRLHRNATRRHLAQLLREEHIDLIHLHFATPEQHYFTELGKDLKIPCVMTVHRGDILNHDKLTAPKRALVRDTLASCRHVIAVSASLAEQTHNCFPWLAHVDVIPNGMILPQARPLDAASEEFVSKLPGQFMLMVANITAYKAPDIAIAAWQIVRDSRPDLHLVIIGEPREAWDSCVQQIHDLNLGEQVHLAGRQGNQAVLAAMDRCQALIFPSRSEGLPYVLLEAGLKRLPVICSDIGPFKEVIEAGRNGLICPVDNSSALAEAALRLSQDQPLREHLARELQATVEQNFSASAMTERYLSFYDR